MGELLFKVINPTSFKDGDIGNLQKIEYFYDFKDFHQY